MAKTLHSHSFNEIHFILSGTATYYLDDKYYEINCGQSLIIPKDKLHKCTFFSENALKTTIAFYIDGDFFDSTRIFDFNKKIIDCIDKMFLLSEENNIMTRYVLFGLSNEIIYLVLKLISAPLPEFTEAKHDPRFLVAKEFIEKNLDKKITTVLVARECCLSPKQLNRIFQKETNLSISGYISSSKLKTAKKLLLKSDLSIKEITYRLGFENEGSFISFFKKHCNITPTLFRKQSGDR